MEKKEYKVKSKDIRLVGYLEFRCPRCDILNGVEGINPSQKQECLNCKADLWLERVGNKEELIKADCIIAYEHCYYDDTISRSRQTSVDYFGWEKFRGTTLSGRKAEHIKTTLLMYAEPQLAAKLIRDYCQNLYDKHGSINRCEYCCLSDDGTCTVTPYDHTPDNWQIQEEGQMQDIVCKIQGKIALHVANTGETPDILYLTDSEYEMFLHDLNLHGGGYSNLKVGTTKIKRFSDEHYKNQEDGECSK